MMLLRTIGKLCLIIAFLALAYDGARMIATPGQGLLLTSTSAFLKNYVPGTEEAISAFVSANISEWLWRGVIGPLLLLPMSFVFGAVGSLVFLAGYRAPPPEIISER